MREIAKNANVKNSRIRIAVLTIAALGFGLTTTLTSFSQETSELTVAQIMNAIIAPTTSTIWGAYEIETQAQWQELENAAFGVIAAGDLLKRAGTHTADSDWQLYSTQMIAAARLALTAIENKDEEALFNAGNDQMYPPCESCHQQFMGQ